MTFVRNRLLTDAAGEQGHYTGPLSEDGLPHGSGGDFRYEGGRHYKGDWLNGKWHGKGQAWFPNGDSYFGEYRLDQRNGMGKYTWKDGRVYEGSFWNDLRHGEGKFKWNDGTFYQGTFVQGQRQGRGLHRFQGGKYKGEFKRGQYHGHGECTWDDGRCYNGEWSEGMAHGQGVETDRLGRILHRGEWQHDEPLIPHGKSELNHTIVPPPPATSPQTSSPYGEDKLEPVVNRSLKDSKGRQGIFRGMVLRGVPHGVGHMVYSEDDVSTYQGFWDYGDWTQGRVEYRNGDVFHGDFQNFLRTGSGEYIWKDGRQYEGEWNKDLREGRGKFFFPNGDMFDGNFVAGLREGPGRFEFHDGSLFEGSFHQGQFHGQGCRFVHKDGRVFLGDFCDGLRHGYGKETYPDGSLRYEGEWENDAPLQQSRIHACPSGFVLIEAGDESEEKVEEVLPLPKPPLRTPSLVAATKDCKTVVEEAIKDAQGNAGQFTGLVLENLPHGVGRMVYEGEIREGFWRNGYLEGHARAFFQNGDFYEGMFAKSQREGKGVYKWKDGRVYEGDYIDDQRHGHGRFIYPSGDEYVGGYGKGMRSGKGKFTFADGSYYDGEWENSTYHGYGELREIGGNWFKGEWKDGKKHGKGMQYFLDRDVTQTGIWNDDEFVEEIDTKEVEEKPEPPPEADVSSTPSSRSRHSFRWGMLDAENSRWMPTEANDRGEISKYLDDNDKEDESESNKDTPEDARNGSDADIVKRLDSVELSMSDGASTDDQ